MRPIKYKWEACYSTVLDPQCEVTLHGMVVTHISWQTCRAFPWAGSYTSNMSDMWHTARTLPTLHCVTAWQRLTAQCFSNIWSYSCTWSGEKSNKNSSVPVYEWKNKELLSAVFTQVFLLAESLCSMCISAIYFCLMSRSPGTVGDYQAHNCRHFPKFPIHSGIISNIPV